VSETLEFKGAVDCQRCGCSWTTRALLPEPGKVYVCCPACGWLSEQDWPSEGRAEGIVVFDASDEEQRRAVQELFG